MIFHPTQSRLHGFADGELIKKVRVKTAAHLERCSKCRNTVGWLRRLSREANALPLPTPPPELRERILESLRRGDRVILPVADPPRPAWPGRRVAAGFSAIVVVAIGASLLRAPELASEASELRFSPEHPRRGDEITIEYHSTGMFAAEDSLMLRAVYRTAANGSTWHEDLPVLRVATLTGQGDHLYTATLRLPEDVVYALFAVEDDRGSRVDSRGRATWELLVYDDDKPDLDALMQKTYDLQQRHWEFALETAQQATELYSNHAVAWFALSSLQQLLYGNAGLPLELESPHRVRFAQLEGVLAQNNALSGADLGAMYGYAVILGDDVAADRWRQRLLREAPEHDLAFEVGLAEVRKAASTDPPSTTLAKLERLWATAHSHHRRPLASYAVEVALESGDPAAMARWLDRYAEFQPSDLGVALTTLALNPTGRELGISRLRFLLGRLESSDDSERALFHTRQDQRRNDRRRRQALAGTLGMALFEGGNVSAGLEYLDAAVGDGWNVELFSQAAEIKQKLGETASAFELWARVAVDPWTSESAADSLSAMAGEAIGHDRWSRMLGSARDMMAEWFVEAAADISYVPVHAQLAGSDGSLHTIGEIMDGRISVFAFWSRKSYWAVRDLETLEKVAGLVEELGGRVITVVDEPWSDGLEQFLQTRHLSFPAYHDAGSEARSAFGVWATPTYFVADGSGRIWFANGEVGELPNQVAALRHIKGAGATPPPIVAEGDAPPPPTTN